MTSLDPIQKLLMEAACKKRVLNVIRATDDQRYEDMAQGFTESALLFRPTAPNEPIQGRQAIYEAYAKRPATRLTRHICSNFMVNILSPERARVICYAQVYGADKSQDLGDHFGPPSDGKMMIGEFEDLCVLENGEWLIAERHARFTMHVAAPKTES